ncbi:trans-resveratrol di-O-methyltransferase-like isoform X1 [Dioscorea cayenensis subsp. rotundata]|uniref:Trans-resveratrol di-O-methyltransferase-like isoform X1 n=1 Tax=Dioscorea cayennensis subsp. rotundata TaxID=55577 RepID=A0AB40CF17_DIOCR|nr:trans-resveratrol di-O-methyltransferase-like isoform X1 [Dioscorea cayenensis subsp. rotundata]
MAEKEFTTAELVEAQAQVWNLMFGYLKSMCLKCSLELGIADVLKKHGKPMELSELTSALSIPPSKFEPFDRFMATLVHLELFGKKQDDLGATKYMLTPASHLLVKDEALNITPLIILNLDPFICDSSHVLAPWFKSPKESPFELYFGKGITDVLGEKPEFNKMLNEGMASDSRFVCNVVMTSCRDVFKGLKSVVDVGGGTGTMARSIAHAFPGIKCTVFDLPHVIDTVEDQQPGVEYVGGDMFASVPHANAVLLKWILNCWNNEECVKILQCCKEAIPPRADGGKIIIIDMVIGAVANKHVCAVETQLLHDLLLMSLAGGKERNEREWHTIFVSAGFTDYKITHFLGIRSIIELYP